MGSLMSSLYIGKEGLQVNQTGLQVVGHNIANVNTPGYSKQEVQLEDAYVVIQGIGGIGMGSRVVSIQGYRDQFSIQRIRQETQNQSMLKNLSEGLSQVETILSPAGGGVRESMQGLFDAIQGLSSDPTNPALRSEIIAKAKTLTGQIHQSYNQLQLVQTTQTEQLPSLGTEINELTSKIADLNKLQLEGNAKQGANISDILDQRDELVRQLADKIGVNTYKDSSGNIMVQTEKGGLLVSGFDSKDLTVSLTGEVFLDGADISSTIKSGKMGGILQVKNVEIPKYMSALDELATSLTTQMNAVHNAGFDLNGLPGADFFVPDPPPASGSARLISVNVSDPSSIAASDTAGEPGNNNNAKALAAVETAADPVNLGGLTLVSHWNSTLTDVGVSLETARNDIESSSKIMTQLNNIRDAASGVSMDEEGVNMIRFQRSYEAMARYMTTIDGLMEALLRM